MSTKLEPFPIATNQISPLILYGNNTRLLLGHYGQRLKLYASFEFMLLFSRKWKVRPDWLLLGCSPVLCPFLSFCLLLTFLKKVRKWRDFCLEMGHLLVMWLRLAEQLIAQGIITWCSSCQGNNKALICDYSLWRWWQRISSMLALVCIVCYRKHFFAPKATGWSHF